MSAEQKIKKLGIELPEAPKPLGSYVPCIRAGNLLFLSGILPLRNGQLTRTGRVGEHITLEEAREDARTSAINALAVVKAFTGNLDTGTERVLVGLKMIDAGIPRAVYEIHSNGKKTGEVVSGTSSPSLKAGIGTGFVATALKAPGTEVEVMIRGRAAKAAVVPLPFYRK